MSRGTLFLFSCLFGDSPVDLCPRKVRSSVGSDVMFGFCVILFISGVFIGFYSKIWEEKIPESQATAVHHYAARPFHSWSGGG